MINQASSASAHGYDQLAPLYQTIEFLAFGRDLERARFNLLPHLKNCRRILVLGEGDGRCLKQLAACAPEAQIDCLDLSAAMLARARKRFATPSANITFRQADILNTELPSQHYDGVITCFFLDCFTTPQVREIVARISRSLQPNALWLWADFVLPPRGIARWRAQVWLTILITFFRWQTGLKARTLPESEALFAAAGFQVIEQRTLQWGFMRSALFSQPGSRTFSS